MRKIYTIVLGFAIALSASAQPNSGGFPYGLGKKNLLPEPAVFKLSPINSLELLQEDAIQAAAGEKSRRFGKDVLVDISPSTHGTNSILPNGSHLWRLLIKSNGATNINLIFDQFDIPAGAKLFVYSSDGSQIRGAFTEKNENKVGNFATLPVQGDQVIIEYMEPKSVIGQGHLHLSYVIHCYRDFNKSLKDFNTSGSCNNNVVCPEGNPWDQQIRSSVVMLTSNNSRYCSGAAVDNTLHDGTPYVLTANHCGPGITDIFLFNYKSPTCSPTTDGPTTDVVQGCILRAHNAASDFYLVELASAIPAEYVAYLSGWSRQDTAPAQAICIHHPDGDVEKISFNTGVTGINAWGGADCWNIPDWEDGTTEPGSSGSPLYNENHQIIGQLYGGDATCSNNVNDNFGRFVTSWDGASATVRLKDWLDPNGSDSLAVAGMEASAPAMALDARMQSIESPVANYCNADSFIPVIRFRNTGSADLTSVTITYQFAGGAQQAFEWTGNLVFNQVQEITLPVQMLSVGSGQLFSASIGLINGSSDTQTNNNALSLSVNNAVGAGYRFELISDNYPEESSWTLLNATTNTVVMEQALGTISAGTTNTDFCLPNACYKLIMKDSYGDGICCGGFNGNGSFTLFDSTGVQLGTGGNFNSSDTISFCVGPNNLADMPEALLVSVYPNPANETLNLRIAAEFLPENPHVQLFTATGQRVWSRNLSEIQTSLPSGLFANGVYLMQISSAKRLITKKIIIQH